MVRCKAHRSNFLGAHLDEGRFEDCDFTGAKLSNAHLSQSVIVGGTFAQIIAERVALDGAEFRCVDLHEASLVESTMTKARFIECDLRACDLRRIEQALDLGSAYGTEFVGCDLRAAKLDGRRLRDTKLVRCRFYGVKGVPDIEGPIEIVDPDMSPAGDGTQIISGGELESRWRS
jgi:uncharacterized protein YjbI with pentapeptide repeats